MGLTGPLPPNITGKMAPETRRQLGDIAETPAESAAKEIANLEREEQRLFATWLDSQEYQDKLVYDWSATNKKVTNRPGMPDFRIYAKNRVLLIEMKIGRRPLSPEQKNMWDRFRASGTRIIISDSADKSIRYVKDWLEAL